MMTVHGAMTEARIGVDGKTRALTLVGVALLHAVVIVALIGAFGAEVVVQTVQSIAAFNISPPPPPEPTPSPSKVQPEGASAPPAPKATPKPRSSPKPKIVIAPKPAPIAASTGTASKSGASSAGAGSGSGGPGTGTGNGGRGTGAGGSLVQKAEKISGVLKTKDFPSSGAGEREGRFIVVRFVVGTDGRAKNCRVVQSSGSTEADTITCRLIEKRFRYRPARDSAGTPVTEETGWKQWWWRPV